jgi:hypothetical protein
MSAIKRLSFSGAAAAAAGEPLHSPPAYGNPSADEWTRWWEQIPARGAYHDTRGDRGVLTREQISWTTPSWSSTQGCPSTRRAR